MKVKDLIKILSEKDSEMDVYLSYTEYLDYGTFPAYQDVKYVHEAFVKVKILDDRSPRHGYRREPIEPTLSLILSN